VLPQRLTQAIRKIGHMGLLLGTSNAIKRVLEVTAFASGWLLIVLMCITCTDVIGRKLGIPIPLTKFQELEWYMHTTLFSMWMGYNYVINAHPRVDSYTETLKFRLRAWIEFWGCLLFALPYCYLLVHHGWDFFWTSYWQNESSENAVGLAHRWLIKGVFYIGLWLLLAGVISVMLRVIVFLFGHRPPGEVDLRIGHAELEV
jgi:TRAP-type mannitol/chloroaromatic compound transport system permease small subunit